VFLLTDDYWEIKNTPKKGRGIFARKNIRAGAVIGDYIGKVIRTAEEETYEGDRGLYLMYYHDRASLYPTDINAAGVHLLNNSCTPNCWMYTYKGHTLFFAIRQIFDGEELTIPYLLSPLDEFCDPCKHDCHCDGVICTGTMHLSKERYDKWEAFTDAQAKETKRARVRYGHELAKLSEYPDTLPEHPIYDLFGSAHKPPKILQDKKLPTNAKLRTLIRDTGLTLHFPHLKKRVVGVSNGEVVESKE
jgi:hypothetical protein